VTISCRYCIAFEVMFLFLFTCVSDIKNIKYVCDVQLSVFMWTFLLKLLNLFSCPVSMKLVTSGKGRLTVHYMTMISVLKMVTWLPSFGIICLFLHYLSVCCWCALSVSYSTIMQHFTVECINVFETCM